MTEKTAHQHLLFCYEVTILLYHPLPTKSFISKSKEGSAFV